MTARSLTIDLFLLALVVLLAAALRFTLLGEVPYGLHPDEAQVGTDARRILDGDPLGPYTNAALGQPSGHAYLAVPFVKVLGDEIIAIRLPLALIALAAVPLLYLFARLTLGRPEAFFASAMLAVSYWHLLYSRVAHWSISYGTFVLAAAVCIVLALQRRSPPWLIAAGAILGAGVYTYNIYPIALVAMGVALAIVSLVCVKREDRAWWFPSLLIAAAIGLIVTVPMLTVWLDRDSEYWEHFDNYAETGLLREDRFEQAPLDEKITLAAAQAKRFAAAYTYDATVDLVDGNGLRAVFDPVTLALLAIGLLLAIRKRRNPAIIIALCCVIILPLPAVLQRGSIMRQPVGAAPFAMLIAALPLAWAWRSGAAGGTGPAARSTPAAARIALRVAAVAAVIVVGTITVRDYFWTWRDARSTAFVYHAEMTAASQYMAALPDGTAVYYYSYRHPFRIETREFLAPDADGTNRAARWARSNPDSIEEIEQGTPVAFVLLDRYRTWLPSLISRYPGGRAVISERNGLVEFVAYELPGGVEEPAIAPP